jgi:hypothetical protein
MSTCTHCGQEIPERREGVRLSPLKARLFDAIKRAGQDGIAGDDLFDLFLRERGAQYTVLKVHVCQINDKLAGTDCMIAVTRMGGSSGIYRLKKAEAAE